MYVIIYSQKIFKELDKSVKENKNGMKQLLIFGSICMIILLVFNAMVIPMIKESQIKETNYSFFLNQIDEGNVKKVEIENTTIKFEVKKENGSNLLYYKT